MPPADWPLEAYQRGEMKKGRHWQPRGRERRKPGAGTTVLPHRARGNAALPALNIIKKSALEPAELLLQRNGH